MMLQAGESQPSDFVPDYAYVCDDDPFADNLSVSYESLIALLDEKNENPYELQKPSENFTESSQVHTEGENDHHLQMGDQDCWPASDDAQGTGLGTLFANEPSENFSHPNTPEKFYTVPHKVPEDSILFKDEPYDLSEYYDQEQSANLPDHLFRTVDRQKCCTTPCEMVADQRTGYASCTDHEATGGILYGSKTADSQSFVVQDYLNGFGSQENSAFDVDSFASKKRFPGFNSASSVPRFLTNNTRALDIKAEPEKSCLTSKNSGGEASIGSFSEGIGFWVDPSNFIGEAILSKSQDEMTGQQCTSPVSRNRTITLAVKEEKVLENSFQMSTTNVDASSQSATFRPEFSFNMPSAESSSALFTGSDENVINHQEFKNIIQSTNTKVFHSDEFKFSQHSLSQEHCYSVSEHSLSQEHCTSFSEVAQCNSSQIDMSISDDNDVCVLEDISAPTVLSGSSRVFHSRSHSSPKSDYCYPEEIPVWHKADDERLTFQMALQDLSEPKLETSPPKGVLTVPLLRHQRIALSWMVQKETSGLNCSGGILADDQGLGKTISTIALILSERSLSSKNCNQAPNQVEIETLNLDDDEEEVVQLSHSGHCENFDTRKMRKLAENGRDTTPFVKGRPSAGTLVVCPTSVLRQWADELRNKVTSEGNLSFLVYHGSNRTKDPNELSNYDVVLTTYSIVSMEVPKQLGSEKDDEEKVKFELNPGLPSNKKRKSSTSSKSKNTADKALIEASARPLARVAWFRVILDEAQTIKNHRTQVARACCGLRAKRRWCLSGTPIQNAIDDLYSYFRFLRYEPYAVYSSFCSTIKIPINKNPNTGYKKLQAVLKTVMLRRTKGTLLDGQPIISLPKKSVTLKKVEFSEAERSFYQRLEAESCEQFKVYAAAGTVKQNYVNILLMLLRLRQACDHPLLVREYDSESTWKASKEAANKLPLGKRVELLNCLEGSQAICTICNDPPEDAVVAICGHVFCNQCVSEHLSGDDRHCPALRCKTKLDAASVFPKSSLSSSISALQGENDASDSSAKVLTTEPFNDLISSGSSKIKAAIEILQALPRLKDPTTILNENGQSNMPCSENASEALSVAYDRMHSCQEQSVAHVRTEKAIVFSQWTRMLDLLELRLKSSSIQFRRLDGTMSVAARDKAIKDFNTVPEVTVMIMSLKAASLGLNLVAACHVLLLDLWWNPTTEDQAIDRAHRIGQTRPVTVSRLTVNNTVEDRILSLQERKRKMVSSAFGEDETGSRQSRLTVEDLKYLFMLSS